MISVNRLGRLGPLSRLSPFSLLSPFSRLSLLSPFSRLSPLSPLSRLCPLSRVRLFAVKLKARDGGLVLFFISALPRRFYQGH